MLTKAVFVDGESLNNMRWSLGIRHYNLKAIYWLITTEIGGITDLFDKPLYTFLQYGDDVRKVESIAKRRRTVGFDVRVFDSSNGRSADDEAIISSIEATDSSVTEIVLVSADQDFVPALSKKVNKGVKVYWVATQLPQKSGNSMIAKELSELFETQFEFIELSHYRDKIMHAELTSREEWLARKGINASKLVSFSSNGKSNDSADQKLLRLTLEKKVSGDQTTRILEDIVEVARKHGLSLRVEN